VPRESSDAFARYASNGTFFLVTDTPEGLPPVDKIISRGLPDGSSLSFVIPPTSQDIQVITPAEAAQRWTDVATMDGMTVFVTDSKYCTLPTASLQAELAEPRVPAVLGHFFHFCGELLYGIWMILVGTLAPGLSHPDDMSTRNTVQRIIFTRVRLSLALPLQITNSIHLSDRSKLLARAAFVQLPLSARRLAARCG